MAATLKEIAKRAKVSMATVSLALNKKPGVGNETRERIFQIAREMEYGEPRRESFGANTNGTIRFLKIAVHGHTVNRDHDVFIADYIEGLTRGASENKYNLEISSFSGKSAEHIVESLTGSNLRGAVILGTELSAEDIQTIGTIKLPIVFLDTYHDFLDFDFVDMNNIDAVYGIVSYFVENGHREIGLVRSGVNTHNFELRDRGFHWAVKALGIVLKETEIYTVDSTFDGAYRDMLGYLKRRSKLPTALFCTNDIIACGCMKALRESGFGVPNDVSVVGFDDLPLASITEPPLTTMKVSKGQIGRLAIERLVYRINNGVSIPSVKIQVGGSLVVRSSVRNLSATESSPRL